MPENCELFLTEDWSSLYRLEPVTLRGCILLSVGDDKLWGWSLLVVGARKSGSWSFLPVRVGNQIECNIYIINNIFYGFFPSTCVST